jgi:hypothetical protein
MLNNVVVLSEKEQQELLNKALTSNDFLKLKEKMESVKAESTHKLSIAEAYKGEVLYENTVIPFRTLILNGENFLSRIYILEFNNNGEYLALSGEVVNPELTNVQGFGITNGVEETPYTIPFNNQLMNQTNILEAFKKQEVEANANWGDGQFCLSTISAGRYNHCGPGCGDYGPLGGGTAINAIDSCCRAHDRCWHNFGKWDPCCDKEICDCVRRNMSVDYVAYVEIYGVFHHTAANC